MTYKQTIEFLFTKLPMYQRKGEAAYKADMGNIIKISECLGNPYLNFKSIHIAGTNGKGSTAHMLASILQEAKLKVGLYTSPHLKDFRERIKINGKVIEKKYITNFISKNKNLFEKSTVSFFEMTVAMAFNYFSDKNVDIAIIETGLGGRLDSTNIINPEISIFTNISYDHSNLLGLDINSIAKEKAGIIKKETPVIIGRKQKETTLIFNKIAKEKNAEIFYAKKTQYKSDLKGVYQKENIDTCICAIKLLQKKGWEINNQHISFGLMHCISNTNLNGRWQILKNKPLTICDTAHNEDGIKNICKQIKLLEYQNLHFILGTVKDKDLNRILIHLPKDAQYYFCKPNILRGLNENLLKKEAEKYNLKGEEYRNVQYALKDAKTNANKEDLIFIGGSTFIVAEVI